MNLAFASANGERESRRRKRAADPKHPRHLQSLTDGGQMMGYMHRTLVVLPTQGCCKGLTPQGSKSIHRASAESAVPLGADAVRAKRLT